jgi:hypothetical protein
MPSKRSFLLTLLVVAELAVLIAIVSVLRGSTSPDVWSWSWGWGAKAQAERWIELGSIQGPVSIHNDLGRVEVCNAASGHGVRAIVYGHGWSRAQAERSLELVTVDAQETEQGVRVEAKSPRNWRDNSPYADIQVVVPPRTAVSVQADMGRVTIRDLEGDVKVESDMGRVEMSRIQGNVSVSAKMGRVELKQMAVEQQLDVDANMGAVRFSGHLGRRNTFKADMGSITIELPKGHAALQLDAEWRMGSIDNELPLTGELKERRATGVLGSGAPVGELRIRSSMGSIHIREASGQ